MCFNDVLDHLALLVVELIEGHFKGVAHLFDLLVYALHEVWLELFWIPAVEQQLGPCALDIWVDLKAMPVELVAPCKSDLLS